jgi:hypothetical protein
VLQPFGVSALQLLLKTACFPPVYYSLCGGRRYLKSNLRALHCCVVNISQEREAALSTQVTEHEAALTAAQAAAAVAAAAAAATAVTGNTAPTSNSSNSAALAQQSAGDSNSATDNNGSSSTRRDSSSSKSNGAGNGTTDTTSSSSTEDALSAAIGAALGLRSYDAGGRKPSADVASLTSSSRGNSYGTNGSFRYH